MKKIQVHVPVVWKTMKKTYTFIIPVVWYGKRGESGKLIAVRASSLKEAKTLALSPEVHGVTGASVKEDINLNTINLNKDVLEMMKVDKTKPKNLPLLIGTLKTKQGTDRLEERIKEL